MLNRIWIAAAIVTLGACSGSTEGKDWDLSEDVESANNKQNNRDGNNDDNSQSANNDNNRSTNNDNNQSTNNQSSNNTTNNVANNTSSCLPATPQRHRPAAATCSAERAPGTSPDFEGDWECETDADCTADPSGRCTGNSHDGWYCTYNECTTDNECAAGSVCECSGGFRSDHNVCLPGNCVTDADCGETGFCSPSQGDCGAYFGTVGYFCHTCEDECVNDSDCGDADEWGSYCMYDQGVGHWRCSDSQCVG